MRKGETIYSIRVGFLRRLKVHVYAPDGVGQEVFRMWIPMTRSGGEFFQKLSDCGYSRLANGQSGRPDGIAPVRAPTPPGVRVRTGRFQSADGGGL
jgi:hypothetical protein